MTQTSHVTVPVEPTEAMCRAGAEGSYGPRRLTSHDDAQWLIWDQEAAVTYRAMLSAAPAPEGGAVLADACRTAARSYAETNDDYMVDLLLKAATALATRSGDKPGGAVEATGARAVIRNGQIVISIDVDALPLILSGSIALNAVAGTFKVTDAPTFAKEVCHALNAEKEDGTTRVHMMFDSAFNHAIDQGAEGVAEISEDEFDAEAARLQAEAKSALATREEAPAEAGELVDHLEAYRPHLADESVSSIYVSMTLPQLDALLSALRAQPQAREDAQPVAWLVGEGGGTIMTRAAAWAAVKRDQGVSVTPLYTRPVTDALRIDHLMPEQQADIRAHVEGLTEQEEEFYDAPAHGWTCFHCGQTFKTIRGAELHFGKDVKGRPECQAPDALRVAVEALEYVKRETSDFAEAWEVAEVCDEKIAALRAQPQAREDAQAWVSVAPAYRFGRTIRPDDVEHLEAGSLFRFYSNDPWFDDSGDMPRLGQVVRFTGNVERDRFPALEPHLEVAALDGRVYPGLGWQCHLFQFVSAPDAHPAPDALRIAVADIAAERQRQIDAEGWSVERDDDYTDRSLAHAAASYALGFDLETRPEVIAEDVSGGRGDSPTWRHRQIQVPASWPKTWDARWWKPSDTRRDLIKAGALIVAEIERLDRAALKAEVAK